MRLICPGCGRPAQARPPIGSPTASPPRLAYSHTDGTLLCPSADDGIPYWPDDHDPRHTIPSIPAGTLAMPRRHPCRRQGAVPAPVTTATVIDRHGGIDCAATLAAGHCPYAAAGMLEHNQGGLQAAGCWLRVSAPHAIITALHRAGTPAPYRVPGLAHDLNRTRVRALATWLRRHQGAYLVGLDTATRHAAAAVIQQTVAWLEYTATTGDGLHVVHAHPTARAGTGIGRGGWPA